MFNKLNEQLERLMEDVVDFASYRNKRAKGAESELANTIKADRQGVSDEELNQMAKNILNDLENDVEEFKAETGEDSESLAKLTPAEVKDYSNGRTKTAQDAEVGDILTYTWGYGMIIPEFYIITERKPSSIKVERLEEIKEYGRDGSYGTCMPATERKESKNNGKLFRLFKPKADYMNDVVCKIEYGYARFWDGRPANYDYND